MEEVIRGDLINGNYRDTRHSVKRVNQRIISRFDIKCCAEDGLITKQSDATYRVSGLDSSNENLDIICGYENGTVIITAY